MATYRGDLMDDLNDMLMGGMGDDILWGGMGDDTLQGGAGDDRLIGGPGGDVLDGGAGSDTADYAMSDARVHVDLESPFDRDDDDPGPVYGGHAEGDSLQSIENIWGSSYSDELIGNHVANMLFGRGGNDKIDGGRGDDKIWGHAGADLLMGGKGGDDMLFGGDDDDLLEGGNGDDILMGQAGDDILEGGDGDDTLEGGMGADDLDGGTGMDTAAYTMSEEGVTINLGNIGTARPVATGGDAMGDTLDKNIENVRGSMEDDKLTGNKYDNKLYGNMGDDTLMGGAGDDTIRGGKDDDEIDGGDGDDMIQGDKGDDELTGGDGDDTFILMEGDGDDEITDFEQGDDTIQLGPSTEKLSAADIRDILDTEDDNRDGTYTYDWPDKDVSITVDVPLKATDFGVAAKSNRLTEGPDNWMGTSRGDVIHGLGGNDTLAGDDGDDNLFGNAGNDRLMGGDDDDTLSGGRGDDNLMGGSGRDMLYGGADDDTLSGNRGNDMLTGGSGSDTFWFGPRDGYDTITDFHQGDIISLGGSPLSMTAIDGVLRTVRVNDDGDYIYDWMETTIVVNRPLTEDDFQKASAPPDMPAIELGDDGEMWPGDDAAENYNDGDNKVYGGDGNDNIDGGRGADMLKGMGGNDTLEGGSGNDTLDGGADDDELMGGSGMDTLMGGSGMDTLMGDSGDDYLSGGSGADELTGGTGNDMLRGGTGADTFMFDGDDGDNKIVDFDKGSDKIMLGDDELTSAEVTMVLADENVERSADDGYIYEWEETTFEVSEDAKLEASDFVTEDEPDAPTEMATRLTPGNDTWGQSTDSDGDEYNGGDDYVMGLAGNDAIDGGAGKDKLVGGTGDDTLTGGAGNDTLEGGVGRDTYDGGAGDDMFLADLADLFAANGTARTGVFTEEAGDTDDTDTLSFEKSEVAIETAVTGGPSTPVTTPADIEVVIGSPHNDKLTLGAAGTLNGGAGNDLLMGSSGADTLMGGAGMDTLEGGGGADRLDGGADADRLVGTTGAETFVWGDDDTIVGFETAVDKIDLSALNLSSVTQVETEEHLGGTLITAGGETVFLEGVTTVVAGDFILS